MNDKNQEKTQECEDHTSDDGHIKSCDRSREEDCHASQDGTTENEQQETDFAAAPETPESIIASLEKKVSELKDMYVRSQAEMQNIQKRNQDEMKKSREYSISNFAKELVPVKDYLEMALKDESGNFEMLKMGVDLTLKQLVQVFENQKIKEISPKAKDKLDPNLHQAMSAVEVAGQEPNTIVSVMQKGYTLHDRILRPAMVTVAK